MAPKVTIPVNSVNILGNLQEGEIHIDRDGILGDNPARSGTIFAFPFKHYAALEHGLGLDDQDELMIVGSLTPPFFGETISLAGKIDEAEVHIGDAWSWGSARLKVIEPGDQNQIMARLAGYTITDEERRKCRCGWLFVVEHPGIASVDDDLILADRNLGSDVLTVAQAFRKRSFV